MAQESTLPVVEEIAARIVPTLPSQEYVSAGRLTMGRLLQALQGIRYSLKDEPSEKDYRDMMKDPAVAQSIKTLKILVLKSGVTFQNPAPESSPDHEKGEEIRRFVEHAFSRLRSPYLRTLWQILDALVYGYKVAEVTYQVEGAGDFSGLYSLKRIAVKPQRATAFVCDVALNVVGFLGLRANGTLAVSNLVLTDVSEVLPREKFLSLSIDPEDEDPRGRSLLDAAFTTWQIKCAVLPLLKKYLARQADPALIGVIGENARPQELRDEYGNPQFNEDGSRKTQDPAEAMADVLAELCEAAAIALPAGSTVTPLTLTGQSDLYEYAVGYFDTMIRSSILLQTLAVAEGKHQARAASQTHADLLADLVQVLKDFVAEALYTDVARVLVRFNYGEEAAFSLTPKVSLGDPNKRDFESAANAFAALGYSVDETQFPEIDRQLGVPIRDPEEVRMNRVAELELKMAAANAVPVTYAPEKGTPSVPTDGEADDLDETDD